MVDSPLGRFSHTKMHGFEFETIRPHNDLCRPFLQWQAGTWIHPCLQSVRSRDMSFPYVAEILCYMHKLLTSGVRIIFLWAPSQVGLAGNSIATLRQRQPYSCQWATWPHLTVTITHESEQPLQAGVSKLCTNSMPSNRRWTLQRCTASHCFPRRDEIIMHWLRIGHSYMTHGYLLKTDCPPQCNEYQTKHTITAACRTWNTIRVNYDSTVMVSPLCVRIRLIWVALSYIGLTLSTWSNWNGAGNCPHAKFPWGIIL